MRDLINLNMSILDAIHHSDPQWPGQQTGEFRARGDEGEKKSRLPRRQAGAGRERENQEEEYEGGKEEEGENETRSPG